MLFNRFWQRHRRLVFILVLFSAPALPLLLLKVNLPRLNFYDRMSSWVVHPSAEAARNLFSGVGVVWDRYIALIGLEKDMEKVKKENEELRAQILSLEESRSENVRLKDLLSMPRLPSHHFIGAKIIGQDSSSESMGFFINVGSRQGVRARMPVVTHQGIVGTVSRVYDNSSMFVSIVDPSHDVDGLIVRSRARFIVEGRGSPLLGRLKYLDRAEDVRVGDLVVTSGLDGVFPKGLRIGSIVKVDRPRTGVSQEAELRSSVDFGHLEEVMVLQYDGNPTHLRTEESGPQPPADGAAATAVGAGQASAS